MFSTPARAGGVKPRHRERGWGHSIPRRCRRREFKEFPGGTVTAGKLNSVFIDNFLALISSAPSSWRRNPGRGEDLPPRTPGCRVAQTFKEAPALNVATGMIWGQPHPCSLLFLVAPPPPPQLPLISVPLSLAWFEVSRCDAPGWVSNAQGLSLSLYHSLDLASCLPGSGSGIPQDPGGGNEGKR